MDRWRASGSYGHYASFRSMRSEGTENDEGPGANSGAFVTLVSEPLIFRTTDFQQFVQND